MKDGVARPIAPRIEDPAPVNNETEAAIGQPAKPRRWTGPKMHHLLFLAFTLVSAVPLAVLAIWEAQTAFQNELHSVRERHLLVARNLTSTMSRYVIDIKSAFSLAFVDGELAPQTDGLTDLLVSLNVVHICILGSDGKVEAVNQKIVDGEERQRPDAATLHALRALAETAPDEPVLSQLYNGAVGRPSFYIVKALPHGRLGLGVVNTSYLVSLQQSIAFGDRGHAVITDAKGQVIAHPLKDWVAASRDLSGVSVVQAMIRGETGVGQFFSPAFGGTMIAGYAVVPETGWGVMVPQPVEELRRRANLVNKLALVIAAAGLATAGIISYLVAVWLTRPLRRVASTAEEVITGNDHISVPAFGHWAPSEIHSLGLAFNTMLDDLRRKATESMQALRQAETSSRAKSQFLDNMSHELRTPLNGVVGMLELLRLSGVSSAQQSYLDQANRSANSLLRMVNDVLDLSEMEGGKISLNHAPFQLGGLIETLRTQFIDIAHSKQLGMAVSLPPHLNIGLIGDEPRLLQILNHLVRNAIKFTDSGGFAIRISSSNETPDSIRIRFEIGDTGIGIPGDVQRHIFDAFAQGDASMTRRHGGSGLGLAIVKELCQRMSGDVGVQSIVGVGSTFWLMLPFQKAAPEFKPRAPAQIAVLPPPRQHIQMLEPYPASAVPKTATSASGQFQAMLRASGRTSFRILLVEDNPANLRVTQALLETLSCDVRTAVNGHEAVAAYRDERYDLILMDCQMPQMDGYQATHVIREIEAAEGRSTPIVALTAHALDGGREQCLAAGMNDQLSKPLTLAALTSKLQEWLLVVRPAE